MNKYNRKEELYRYQNASFSDAQLSCSPPYTMRRSIILIALDNPDISVVDIQKLMEGGMNIAQLTCYTMRGNEAQVIAKCDKAAQVLSSKYGVNAWPCAICIELKTCIIKTGLLESEKDTIFLEEKSEIILSYNLADVNKCNEQKLFVDNPYLTTDVKVGMELSIAEDKITLEVTEINENSVKCVVTKAGQLGNMENVCMRGAQRTRPYITKDDLERVKIAIENQADMIIVSYVRHPDTIRKIKQYIGKPHGKRPWLVGGLCTNEGLRNMDEIIKECDAILFARERLAYELERKYFERMARIQKHVIGKCQQANKPVLLSGQVFESLLETGRLENRDVLDVANALVDGVSGFAIRSFEDTDMLRTVIRQLTTICDETEPFTSNEVEFKRSIEGMGVPVNAAVAAAMCSVLLANKTQAHAIIIPTVSGRTIFYVNPFRPICPIVAVTTNVRTFRHLKMFRSAIPLLYEGGTRQTWNATVAARLEFAILYCLDKGWLNYGDDYVSLEKDLENSSFCDTVRINKVVTKKKKIIVCPDPVDANVFATPIQEP